MSTFGCQHLGDNREFGRQIFNRTWRGILEADSTSRKLKLIRVRQEHEGL